MTRNFAASAAAIAAILALAPAVGAQGTAGATTQPPPATAVPAPAPTPAPAPQAGPAAEPGTPAPAPNPQIVAFIDQEFPKADTDGDGKLSQTEFKAWITRLKIAELQAQGQPVDPAKVEIYATNAFTMTDKDSDGLVDKADLIAFFSGG